MAREAVYTGSTAFQYFTRNPRGGAAKQIVPEDLSEFIEICREHGITSSIAHAPYTLNPCSQDARIHEFALNTLTDDLKRVSVVPGCMYNLHPGSHVGLGVDTGIKNSAGTISRAMEEACCPGVTLLIETMAGKGSEIGGRFEEVREIIDAVGKENVGVCLDTCHVYDAGYDIKDDLDGVLTAFDKIIGLSRLKAVHLNDSKNPMGSHKDRHETIGNGSIGTEAFARIINHPALRDLTFCLETPNDTDGYKAEISLLRSLRKD